MKKTTYQIRVNGEAKEYPAGTAFSALVREYQPEYEDDIVLVMFNNRLKELHKTVKADGELTFVTTRDKAGRKAYRRSVTFLMQRAVHNLSEEDGRSVSVRVEHSISQGYYCELAGQTPDKAYISRLKEEMRKLVEEKLPIKKKSISTDDAVALFRELGMRDKERLFAYRRSSKVNIYSIGRYEDYFYGYMVPDTGYLKYFELELYEGGFVLLFPDKDTHTPSKFVPSHKLFHVLKESAEWGAKLDIATIGALNDAISQGRIRDVILVSEALMERKIGRRKILPPCPIRNL